MKVSLFLVLSAAALSIAPVSSPRVTRVYVLSPREGVFAYARISPSGDLLAYASETSHPHTDLVQRTVVVVDLASGQRLFSDLGRDAYWDPDGQRLIYMSTSGLTPTVAIWHRGSGQLARDVAPSSLGDYYSWGTIDGRDIILTILGHYFFLDGDSGIAPAQRIGPCPGIGSGERPLLSKDGIKVTTFVRGHVTVRNLADCQGILETGIPGGKADFSWDGRYIAFHAPKPELKSYEIQVVDLRRHTVRTVTALQGSALFPSWTRDGRLCFRYDGPDYRGFMMADHVLDAPERSLPARPTTASSPLRWNDVVPGTSRGPHDLNVVLVWAPWSAHAPEALQDFQLAADHFANLGRRVDFNIATELSSERADADQLLRQNRIRLREVVVAPWHLVEAEALNQMPTTLLFRGGALVDRRLGAQSFTALSSWIEDASKHR